MTEATDLPRMSPEEAAAHATQRALPGVLVSLAVLVACPLLALLDPVERTLGNTASEVGAASLSVIAFMLSSVVVYRRYGVESRFYQRMDIAETALVQLAVQFLIFTSDHPFSPFWVMYVLHAGNIAYSCTTAMYRGLTYAIVLGSPIVQAVVMFATGEPVRALICVLMGMAGANAVYHAGTIAKRLRAAYDHRVRLESEIAALRVADERRRIARDLHDGVGADLAAIAWRAAALVPQAGSPRIGEALAQLTERATSSIDEVRSVVWALDHGQRRWSELATYLRGRVIELAVRQSAPIVVRIPGAGESASGQGSHEDPEVPGPFASHLVRVVLEAVRNAIQHGDGGPIEVHVGRMEGVVEIGVVNGVTAMSTAERVGAGLANLDDRARLLGGTLTVDQSEGRFELRVRAPWPDSVQRGTVPITVGASSRATGATDSAAWAGT